MKKNNLYRVMSGVISFAVAVCLMPGTAARAAISKIDNVNIQTVNQEGTSPFTGKASFSVDEGSFELDDESDTGVAY